MHPHGYRYSRARLSDTDKTCCYCLDLPENCRHALKKKKPLFSFAFRLKTLIQRVAKEYREHFNR